MIPGRTALAAALILVCGGSVAAQSLNYSDQAVSTCVSAAQSEAAVRECVGKSADACMAATPDGQTTVGMGGCLNNELAFWDRMLNDRYQAILTKAQASDAEMASMGSSLPKVSVTLRDMQRAWIAYRDATCDFERSQWGGGTGGGPATLSCLMRLTADQVLYLHTSWLGD